MEHPQGDLAVWQVRQRGSQSPEGVLPLVQRTREAIHVFYQQVCQDPAEDAFVEQTRQQTAQFQQTLGKIPRTEVAHGRSQDRQDSVLVELFVALEMLRFDAGADGLQRLAQRPACCNGLCCKQPAEERPARQRLDSCGAFRRRVECAPVDMEARAFDPEFPVIRVSFRDPAEVPFGGLVFAASACVRGSDKQMRAVVRGKKSIKGSNRLFRTS